jgi:hypothetical protein
MRERRARLRYVPGSAPAMERVYLMEGGFADGGGKRRPGRRRRPAEEEAAGKAPASDPAMDEAARPATPAIALPSSSRYGR